MQNIANNTNTPTGTTSPFRLGAISTDPKELAQVAMRIATPCAAFAIFVDNGGSVLFQDAAVTPHVDVENIVGIYSPQIDIEDLADDLRSCCVARLAAIGILV